MEKSVPHCKLSIVKMLVEEWIHIPVWVSLLVIIICITASIIYSIHHKRAGIPDGSGDEGADWKPGEQQYDDLP